MNDMTRTGDVDPPYLFADYRSTRLRSPLQPLLQLPAGALDVPGPLVPAGFVRAGENDLTRQGASAPLGEKMVLSGRLLYESGRPLRRS
ncbi:MAG TPA: protocatechuate 3,4-dioxygenase subunit beta, partial [Usitatibacter sp.]|nr:protocatechuate 3,4-dioxygenase subunit beta [Usitatibacter sp.]